MTTKRERLENKIAKREEWAEKARKRGEALQNSRDPLAGIPFGQPILVGHHSEARHRRDIEKSWNRLGKIVGEERKADYHEEKAAGIESMLKKTIFSDDENAIEALEAKIANLEGNREAMKKANAARRKHITARKKDPTLPEYSGAYYQSWELSNLGATIRNAQKRIRVIQATAKKMEAVADCEDGFLLEKTTGGWAVLTFPEFPGREAIKELKDAGFYWSRPSWRGAIDKLPEQYQNHA